ncbi:MAG: helix-turn-helix domain-containing protein [Firmicutes bacterium]|nr:helix-turn-helix domain-containing protein [Bacillota bacterium]
MTEIGSELKNARENLGLTLDEIMDRTMIPKKQLKALEEEKFDVFPGEVYLKGALRKYATELGLNADELLDRYKRTKAKTAEEEEEIFTYKKSNRQQKSSKTPVKRKRLKVGRLIGMLLILLVLLTAFHTLVELYERRQSSPPLQNEQPQNEQLPDELPEPFEPEPAEPEEPEQPEIPSVQVEQDPEAEGVRFVVYHADSIEAELAFTGACWIRVLADGDTIFEGTLQHGQTKTVTAEHELSIRLGNPPVTQLTINEQPVQLPETVHPYTLTIMREE